VNEAAMLGGPDGDGLAAGHLLEAVEVDDDGSRLDVDVGGEGVAVGRHRELAAYVFG
jgi:hypothetical protein